MRLSASDKPRTRTPVLSQLGARISSCMEPHHSTYLSQLHTNSCSQKQSKWLTCPLSTDSHSVHYAKFCLTWKTSGTAGGWMSGDFVLLLTYFLLKGKSRVGQRTRLKVCDTACR